MKNLKEVITTITYKGFNEAMEKNIRWYMNDCPGITEERESEFFIPENHEEGTRTIVFEGILTHGEEIELEDMGVNFNLEILTSDEI